MSQEPPRIGDLGLIGDRHSAAVVTRRGDIVWFCPTRFDTPSLFNALLDQKNGGAWRLDLPGATPQRRGYINDSAVLETWLDAPAGPLRILDFMPLRAGEGRPQMICRLLTQAPAELRLSLVPRPGYGQRIPPLQRVGDRETVIEGRFFAYASHEHQVERGAIHVRLRQGESAWAVLADGPVGTRGPDRAMIGQWLTETLADWQELAKRTRYDGPYADEARRSLRALHLLTFDDTGAIVAAPTTSLPEIIGGERNYDYRFSWLRDTGLMIRALGRLEEQGREGRRYLGYVAGMRGRGYHDPLDPVFAVAEQRVPSQGELPMPGYKDSRPVLAGNKAAKQVQLGSFANFLLAAGEVYRRFDTREHWHTVEAVADYLAGNWRQPDSGIWEEAEPRQFTTSKVFSVCALQAILPFAPAAKAERYRTAIAEMRAFVDQHCLTPAGGFAAEAGTDTADISAALYPVWEYVPPDDPRMVATIEKLEREYSPDGILYHRHLHKERKSREEGAFLAGTFWVAHYWVVRGDLTRARRIMEGGLRYANDLGLFSEEVDPPSGELLGNIPLGLVHASFLSAAEDLARRESDK